MTRLVRLAGLLLLLTASVVSSAPLEWRLTRPARTPPGVVPFVDQSSQLRLDVPPGWRVRAETLNGVRQLTVIPPKADQRERAAIHVVIRVRPFADDESLERLAADFRQAHGDREAATLWRYSPKVGRLVVEYREGRYVSGQLWIVRLNLGLYQRVDKNRLLEVHCAANASEYKTYRRNLEAICYSVAYGK